jgi:serine/threonine-protein kinase
MMSHRLVYETGAMARFEREANLLLDLEHPNIARVLRRFEAYRTAFMVMEFCDGADLSRLLGKVGQLDEEQTRRAIGQIAKGVVHMHARNIIHRDLKPQNVLLTSEGTLKLTDFGLAKPRVVDIESALTIPGSVLGTPLYMAPEQLAGRDPSPAGDIYAIGCIGWQLLTGTLPFAGRSLVELADSKRSFRLPRRREIAHGISRQTHAFLKRSLAADPKKRRVDIAAVAEWAGPLELEA